MNFNILPTSVLSFNIDKTCVEGLKTRNAEIWPCRHSCTISLDDGRKETKLLNGCRILILINAIHNDFITGSADSHHFFDNYKDKIRLCKETPEQILTNLFK